MLLFKAYSPSKRRFKRIINDDLTSKSLSPNPSNPPHSLNAASSLPGSQVTIFGSSNPNIIVRNTLDEQRAVQTTPNRSLSCQSPELSPSGLTLSPRSNSPRSPLRFTHPRSSTDTLHSLNNMHNPHSPQQVYYHHNYDNSDDADLHDSDEDELTMPKKRGPKVNSTFLTQPQGDLSHPYIDWVLDKASMDEFMPLYAKQEGFAVNVFKEHHGKVIRWRCIHAGKYNGHRRLPAEVTVKDCRKDAIEAGTSIIYVD